MFSHSCWHACDVFYEFFINHVDHELTSNNTITFININHDGKNVEDGGHSHCLELMNFQHLYIKD